MQNIELDFEIMRSPYVSWPSQEIKKKSKRIFLCAFSAKVWVTEKKATARANRRCGFFRCYLPSSSGPKKCLHSRVSYVKRYPWISKMHCISIAHMLNSNAMYLPGLITYMCNLICASRGRLLCSSLGLTKHSYQETLTELWRKTMQIHLNTIHWGRRGSKTVITPWFTYRKSL